MQLYVKHFKNSLHKQEYWLPNELKPKNFEKRLLICQLLLQRERIKVFLDLIATDDEKWIDYGNAKTRNTPDQQLTSVYIERKTTEYCEKHDKAILQHNNFRPNVVQLVTSYLETLRKMLLLPITTCSDLEQNFTSYEDCQESISGLHLKMKRPSDEVCPLRSITKVVDTD